MRAAQNRLEQELERAHRGREEDRELIRNLSKAVVNALAMQEDQPRVEAALAQLAQGNTEAAETIFEEVLVLKAAQGKAFNQEAAEAARHLGTLAFLHDTEKALEEYRQAVALDPDNPEGWNELGHLLSRIGELDEAEAAYHKVLALGKAAQDKGWIASAYGNLGIVYQSRGELDQAETMYHQSLEINEALGRKQGMANAYGNLGNVYRIRGELDQAERMFRQSLEIHKALGHKEGMASAYTNLGIVYEIRGELDQAEAMYRQSLVLSRVVGAMPQMKHVQELLDALADLKQASEDATKP